MDMHKVLSMLKRDDNNEMKLIMNYTNLIMNYTIMNYTNYT